MQSIQQEKSRSPGLFEEEYDIQCLSKSSPKEGEARQLSLTSQQSKDSENNSRNVQFSITSPTKPEQTTKPSLPTDKKSQGTPNLRNAKYEKISDSARSQILFRCMVMHEPLRQTSRELGINFSSAKNVIQVYKKEGRLNKKTSRLKRTSEGELVDRMDEIGGEALQELKKKICPVKVDLNSITEEDIKVKRNEQIYVPLSGGRTCYECIKLTGIEKPEYILNLDENDFEAIFQKAQQDLSKQNGSLNPEEKLLY